MRWSLKTTFLVVTVIALFLASKYNARNRKLRAAKQIQDFGGEVSYQWQQPSVGSTTPGAIILGSRDVPYTTTMPDGTTETKTYNVRYTRWNLLAQNKISHGSTQPPTRNLLDAIWPNNSDVIVEAVQINEEDVNETFLATLRNLKQLKILQICRPRSYFAVLGAEQQEGDWKEPHEQELRRLGEPFETAKALVQNEFPDLNIVDGMVSDDSYSSNGPKWRNESFTSKRALGP